MKYEIVYDTSADKYGAERMVIRKVGPAQLARKILALQAQGNIIYAVRQINY